MLFSNGWRGDTIMVTKPDQDQGSTGEQLSTSDDKPIVVAVDGSMHNKSAIAWAAQEAEQSKRELTVLMVTEKAVWNTTPFRGEVSEPFDVARHATNVVEKVVAGLATTHPGLIVRASVRGDDVIPGLLTEAERAEMVVVGQRGLGAFQRMMVGSTSIALAGRSTSPTIVVPDRWEPTTPAVGSVLVGIDPHRSNESTLEFGFKRAHELRVPLVALYVWNTHPALVLGADEQKRWGHDAQAMVETQVVPFRQKFPDVEALAAQRHAAPALGVLDAADHAQLTVLGRRSSGSSPLGFGFGSVGRAVLHYTDGPVAIVPSDRRHDA
jgi:nucleotide-binding universal stress UspA family protein